MRKWILVAALLQLTGCSAGTKEIDRAMALRSKLLQAETVSFDAEVTADYGDALYIFGMRCQGDTEGNVAFEVTAPETLSGISGTVGEEGGSLTFEDTALSIRLLTEDQLNPVSAPWIFLQTLRSGYLTSAGWEGDELRLTINDSYEEDALQLDIWLGEGDLPQRAEILYDGKKILSLAVENFEME